MNTDNNTNTNTTHDTQTDNTTTSSAHNQALKARYQKALTAFYKLPERDRMALILLSSFLGLLIIVYGVILPAMDYHQQARQTFQDEQALLYWLKAQEPAIQAVRSTPQTGQSFSGNPLSLVNGSAKDFQLSIKRLQPENSGNLRVWMENVNFDNTLQWLHHLQAQGLKLSDISIDQQAKGRVNIRATFEG
ncbi:type II secretion system protein GspM [Pseudomaricurvus sp.]|uniref:type II secretion system protein GspM n=1 Tax=Pseudomaricurvus sp. TaxID=2004510 RepID=UPI003F6D0E68